MADQNVVDRPNHKEQIVDNAKLTSNVAFGLECRANFHGTNDKHRPVVNAVPNHPAYQPTLSTVTRPSILLLSSLSLLFPPPLVVEAAKEGGGGILNNVTVIYPM